MSSADMQLLLNSTRPEFNQPQVPADMELLQSGYYHNGLWIDLWGYLDSDSGYDVQTVSLTGTRIAMNEFGGEMNGAMLRKMSDKLDREAFKRKEDEKSQQAISAYEWERMMS